MSCSSDEAMATGRQKLPISSVDGTLDQDAGTADKEKKDQSSPLVALPTSEVRARMESVQEILDQMQQLVSETMATCPQSAAISASIVDAALLALNPRAARLQEMLEGIATLGRTSHFSLFPKLPAELRIKIWREAMPGPRVVDVFLDHVICALYSYCDDDPGMKPVLRANQPPPVLLHVCSESRRETLKQISQIGELDPSRCLAYSYALLDLSKDTVFMPLVAGVEHHLQGDLFDRMILTDEAFDNLKYLAIESEMWNSLPLMDLTNFKNLVEISIVCHEDGELGWELVESNWRMHPTTFELVDIDISSDPSGVVSDVLGDIRKLKAECQEWREPKVTCKTIVRGGRQCCFYDSDTA